MHLSSLDIDSYLKRRDLDPRYSLSPFVNLQTLPPRTKGARFDAIVAEALQAIGISPKYAEIRSSMYSANTQLFSFLQIRSRQKYDAVFFAMFHPTELVIMQMNRLAVELNIQNGTFRPQHGGAHGESGTFMFHGDEHSLANIGATEILRIDATS